MALAKSAKRNPTHCMKTFTQPSRSEPASGSRQLLDGYRVMPWIPAAALLAILLATVACTAHQPAEGTTAPDLSGAWDHPEGPDVRLRLLFTTEEPPMQPWAEKRYQEARKGRNAPDSAQPDQGRSELDSAFPPYCMPYGFPRVYATTDAFEILQYPDRMYIIFESGGVQRIYTDGRKHPKGAPLTFMGQSIGRWEGDTFVVETKDMNDLTWIDGLGHPHSEELRVEQRIRRVDPNTLEIHFLFDDPKTYTKPWTAKKVYTSRPRGDVLMNYFICEEPKTEEYLRDVRGSEQQ